MMAGIFTLTYVSAALAPFTLAELGDLTRQSQTRNAELGVTGILVYQHPSIFQTLEGDERTVRGLFEAITADPRHHAVVEKWSEIIPRRRYPQWSMNLISDGQLHHVLASEFSDAELRAAAALV